MTKKDLIEALSGVDDSTIIKFNFGEDSDAQKLYSKACLLGSSLFFDLDPTLLTIKRFVATDRPFATFEILLEPCEDFFSTPFSDWEKKFKARYLEVKQN